VTRSASANGYRIERITDLRTGERLHFDQRGGTLTVKGITDWDQYDTVFKVTTAAHRQGVHPTGLVKAGEPALTDGDFTTYSDNKGVLPAGYTLDLGRVRRAAFLGINQREWSPTHNRETFGRKEDSARIKDYTVSVSDDGATWREEKAGVLESARGIRFIDLGDRLRTRCIRLDVSTTWAAATVPNFYQQLKIDEIQVGYGHPLVHG
jgi:hypothetical protein